MQNVSSSSLLEKPKEVIAVVGAGLAGCMCAIFLARAGYQVRLIEKAPYIMAVSSKIPIHLHSGGLYLNDMVAAKHCLHDSINFMKVLPFAVVNHPTAFAVMTLDDSVKLLSGKTQLMEEALALYNKDHAVKDLPSSAFEYLEKAKAKMLSEGKNINEEALKFYKSENSQERWNVTEIPAGFIGEYQARALRQFALTLYNIDHAKKEIPKGDIEKYKILAQQQFNKWKKMKDGFEQLKDSYRLHIEHEQTNKVFGEIETYYKAYEQNVFADLKRTAQKISQDPLLADKDAWTQQLARITDPNQVVGVLMSSEFGLNMIRAAAGLKLEIDKLVREKKIILFFNTQVTSVNHNEDDYNLVLRSLSASSSVPNEQILIVSQVVNATGYRGKELDDKIGLTQDWTVDVKGAGVIQLNDDTFLHTPGVFFTEAKGMAQMSCFNARFAGLNYTTLDVPGTYVAEGIVTFDKAQRLEQSTQLAQLEASIINKPSHELLERTRVNIQGCSRFIPQLTNPSLVEAAGFVPGSLGLVGKDKNVRDSKEVYVEQGGYHAVNLAKGGGAVSTAMALTHNVVLASNKKFPHQAPDPFPQGSNTRVIPEQYIITTSPEIDAEALTRARNLGLSEGVGLRYNSK